MSNNLITEQDSRFETASRALIYKIPLREIGQKCKPATADGVVLRVLRGDIHSGSVYERVIPIAKRAVEKFEKKNNISIGGGN